MPREWAIDFKGPRPEADGKKASNPQGYPEPIAPFVAEVCERHGEAGCAFCEIRPDMVEVPREVMEKVERAAEDALHTLENTKSCEPGWQKGSIELLIEALAAMRKL